MLVDVPCGGAVYWLLPALTLGGLGIVTALCGRHLLKLPEMRGASESRRSSSSDKRTAEAAAPALSEEQRQARLAKARAIKPCLPFFAKALATCTACISDLA